MERGRDGDHIAKAWRMSGTRRRAQPGTPARYSAIKPEIGLIRVGSGMAGAHLILAQPGLGQDDLVEGLEMLEEVIADGDATARTAALCLLALMVERLPTAVLQARAEELLVLFTADYVTGAGLRATIGRLRGVPEHSLS